MRFAIDFVTSETQGYYNISVVQMLRWVVRSYDFLKCRSCMKMLFVIVKNFISDSSVINMLNLDQDFKTVQGLILNFW